MYNMGHMKKESLSARMGGREEFSPKRSLKKVQLVANFTITIFGWGCPSIVFVVE